VSEEAKIAYLREKIAHARGQSRGFSVVLFLGIFSAVLGYVWLENLTFTILGVFVALVGGGFSLYFDVQKTRLLEELGKMASTSKCPKCGKQTPQGNFAFCPFLRALLRKRQITLNVFSQEV